MGKGDCLDRVVTLAKGNGQITVTISLGWDGVSAYPDCDGPINSVRIQNTGTTVWYLHLPKARGGSRAVAITAGVDRSFTGAQLAQIGLVTIDDISELRVTQSPDPTQARLG